MIIVEDVLHEIDLYVSIDMGYRYTGIYIFECKNWQANVDKNEIIIFSEKIRVTNAAKRVFYCERVYILCRITGIKNRQLEFVLTSEETDKFPCATPVDAFQSQVHDLRIGVFAENSKLSIELDPCWDEVSLNNLPIALNTY